MSFETLRETLEPWIVRPWVQALALVLISVVAAKIFDWLITNVVRRFAAKTRTDIDDKIITLLHRPVFLSVFLFGLRLATERLALPPTYEITVIRILKTIAIIIWVAAGVKISHLVLELLSRQRERFQILEAGTLALFENLSRVVLVGGAIYFIFLSWDINVSAWLASAGIVGLAVGFAAKDTIANLFGGVFIVADKPYDVGDFINLDTGERGQVTAIGLRTTRLLTRDDIEITIPNAIAAQSKIINESGGPWEKERLRVKVGVAYGTDVDQLEELLLGIAAEHADVCEEPAPRVRFRVFGDSSLDFELLCWVDEPVLRGRVLHELNKSIYKAFATERIEIPYPKRDVYLHQTAVSDGTTP